MGGQEQVALARGARNTSLVPVDTLGGVGVRQDVAQVTQRDWIPPAPLQCPGEPHLTPLCQRHLQGGGFGQVGGKATL